MTNQYNNISKPSDIKGLKIACEQISKFKKLADSIANDIEKIEEIKGIGKASDKLYLDQSEAEETAKCFKAVYDAGYQLLQAFKEQQSKASERVIIAGPSKEDTEEFEQLKVEVKRLRCENNDLKERLEDVQTMIIKFKNSMDEYVANNMYTSQITSLMDEHLH